MKAVTKAEKRRRKKASNGGRPRKPGEREPNGQPSRKAKAQEVKSVVVDRRIRLAASKGRTISAKTADNPLLGYVAGRKYLNGDFGKIGSPEAAKRLQTGNDVAATWDKCRRIVGYPPISPQAANWGKVRGLAIEPLDAQARGRIASNTMMRFELALGQAGQGCKSAFLQVFMADEPAAEDWPPHMNALLKKALDALAGD